DRRGRRKRQVDDAERYAQALAGDRADELAHAGDLERSLFDDLGHFVNRTVARAADRRLHHARAGYTDVDNSLRFADAVERARHERVIVHRVGKYHELGAAHRVVILGQLGGL